MTHDREGLRDLTTVLWGRVRGWWREIGLFCLVAVPYAAGAVWSRGAFGAALSPSFFAPAGVTVAAMLLTRRSLWPVIVAAIVLAELVVDLSYGVDVRVAAGWAVANSVE